MRIVMMGVSGSGKSTVGSALAARLKLPFIEGDELHPPENVARMAAGTPLTDADRAGWLDAVADALKRHPTGVVVSCSALKRSYRERLRRAAPDLRLVHLHGAGPLLAERLAARSGHYMPASLLQSQLDILEPPAADESALVADIARAPADLTADLEDRLETEPKPMIDAATFRLDGRVALITGSSGGIGFALARGLAQAGATVVLNGRDRGRLAAAFDRLAGEGLSARSCNFDATDAEAVEDGIASIERDVGPIDVLINNAGITRRAPFHELSAADWQAVIHTNVDGLFIVGQAVAKRMVPRKRGRIINICSVMSEVGRPGTSAYTTSKGAAKMLTKAMAVDLAPHGINVNAIGPGYFETELTAPLRADAKFNDWLINRTPMRRWGRVEELAPVAVFLASDASSFVNGHVLYADGAITATL